MMSVRIAVDSDAIADFCARHHITRFAFFGSVLRDDFRPDSDVDVLVEFEEDREPGLMRLAAMERELSSILKRQADIRRTSADTFVTR
jgi:predicted nucleotidyltransferase